MTSVSIPARSPEQRKQALALANKTRHYRADVKHKLKAQTVGLFDVIEDPLCASMKVREVLLSLPNVGDCKTDRVLRRADISHSKTCAGMTPAQRQRLVWEIDRAVFTEIRWRA